MSERELLVLSEEPLNAETRLDLLDGPITPAGRHYVRSHFARPAPRESFTVRDLAGRERAVSTGMVRSLPSRILGVTLECAGNGRRFLEPPAPGEQWGLGAVGTAKWTGASLREVLASVGTDPGGVEVLFRGADEGAPKDLGRRIGFERSLPMARALDDDVLVAYAMNGEPIPPDHGGALRLIVPGWYGVASVKWLAAIEVLDRPFTGFFQKDRYVIDGRPLTAIAPRAVITSPVDGAEVVGPGIEVRGYAWSGSGPIERVDVRLRDDCIDTTAPAKLEIEHTRHAWRRFRARPAVWREDGGPLELELRAIATDAAGSTQPLEPDWNALGYRNNAARPVRVRVVPRR